MADLVCVGHNTVDKYMSQNMMYPGGNEVNVAALTSRYGISSSYVGWIGTDIYGNLILEALQKEGVNTTHCHIKDGVNTFTEIYQKDGERRFGKTRRGTSTHYKLSDDDIEFILSHEFLHTGYYSRMEDFLKNYHHEITVSFDFTEYADQNYLMENMEHVDIAFISSQKSTDIVHTMEKWYDKGPELVILTMGRAGSYLYNGELHHQPAIQLDQVVDTLGAGDSFIARFLVEYIKEIPLDLALDRANQSAAKTCQYYGAFGHGIELKE